MSRDASWLSPVLTRRLPDTIADVVAAPTDVEDVRRVVDAARRHGVPMTPRGKGTGNYGQSVPLFGGLVLDLTGCSSIIDVTDEWITAETGASFVALEAAARRVGRELAMFPSTVGSTLGGFLAGGAGGTGSIENGFIWDGFVGSLDLVSCTDDAPPFTVDADDVDPYLHAYGTTGIITRATVRLVPARAWVALYGAFSSFADAVAAGTGLLSLDPLPRGLSIDDAAITAFFPSDPAAMPPGAVSLRAMVEVSTVSEAERILVDGAGRVTATRANRSSALASMSYNHVTLRAKRSRPDICHVQAGGAPLLGRAEDVRELFDDGLIHLDAHRVGDHIGFGGLILSTFVDEPTLRSRMATLADDLGVFVVDPHTWMVGSQDLASIQAAARLHDPDGLLNPGKLGR